MNDYNKIVNLMTDKRMAIGLMANPIPTYKVWLNNAITLFENKDFYEIKKDIIDFFEYSKKLCDKNALKLALSSKFTTELHFAETYLVHQKYFFYNELFNYGAFQNYFFDKIKETNLDITNTLYDLTKYKKSLAFTMSGKGEINFVSNENDIPKEITILYNFLIDIQTILYNTKENFSNIYEVFEKRYKDLNKKYKQKAKLFEVYLKNADYDRYCLENKLLFYKNYLFNTYSGEVIELDPKNGLILETILKRKHFKIPAIIINESLKLFIKNKILILEKSDKTPEYYRIFYEITNDCNLNCRYCFSRDFKRYFELNVKDWIYLSEYLPKKAQVNLFGGEPFIKEGIKDLFSKLDELLTKKDIKEVRCFTNGVETEKILSTISGLKNKFQMLISLDGTKESNTKIRGKNNFEKTIETIKRIKTETKHIIWVKMLITKLNYDSIPNLVKLLDSLKVDFLSFGELQIEGNAKNKENEQLSFEEEFSLITKIKQTDHKLKIKEDDISQDFLINRCGYGYCLIYIRSDGFIGGCTEDDTAETHIFELYPNLKKFKQNPLEFIPKKYKTGMVSKESICSKCSYVNICLGGCFARAKRNNSGCDEFRKQKVEFIMNKIFEKYKF